MTLFAFVALVAFSFVLFCLFVAAKVIDVVDSRHRRTMAREEAEWERDFSAIEAEVKATRSRLLALQAGVAGYSLEQHAFAWSMDFANTVSSALYAKPLAIAMAEVQATKQALMAEAGKHSECSQVRAVGGTGQPCGDCIACWTEELRIGTLSDLHGTAHDTLQAVKDKETGAFLAILPSDWPRGEPVVR